MKKLLFPLFAVAAMVLASCSSDDDDKEPVGTHYYTIATEDMSWGRVNQDDIDYIANFFTDDVRMFTMEGTKDGADQKALEYYNNILSDINDARVCDAFPTVYDEGMQEYLYFAVHLTRTEGGRIDTLASKRWALNGVEEN